MSQDVDGLDDGAVVASLLLTPKGKVHSSFRIVRVGDGAWLDIEAGFGEALAGRARAVQAAGEGGDRGSHRAVGDGRDPRRRVRRRRRTREQPRSCRWAWSTTIGVDVIGPRADLAGLAARGLDADQYERARVEAGIPRLGPDLDESTIPQEAWLDRDAVSFTKGCYLGQELVARIDSRGHVNRVLRWLRPSDAGDRPRR